LLQVVPAPPHRMSTGFNYGETSNRGPQLPAKFVLEHELTELRLLLERQAGVLLNAPQEILCQRLAEYLRERRIGSVADLLGRLQASDSECERVLDRLLDGETCFFRHPAAFAAFEKEILPELHFRKLGESGQSLRILSAGCSTGEEAYSIGLSVCKAMNHNGAGWTIHILASDVRQSALTFAERGLYPQASVAALPASLVREYFARVDQHVLAKSRLRNLITFTQMNLARPIHLGRFDCIFCMDVLPHFSTAQRIALTQRLHLYLEPGGYLLLGDGEKLPAVDVAFHSASRQGCTLYRKPLAAAARAGKPF
ncbi:MAG TPA: protein-glutamate O-methyltransferase CheR, partial [Terriglobales bacterium]|nr:protein-glutamate O-methyltransferase CheR [Terriglobales bacterium]